MTLNTGLDDAEDNVAALPAVVPPASELVPAPSPTALYAVPPNYLVFSRRSVVLCISNLCLRVEPQGPLATWLRIRSVRTLEIRTVTHWWLKILTMAVGAPVGMAGLGNNPVQGFPT
jgi:hypothetical protein